MALYRQLYRKIRDDMFLTGRLLQNASHHDANAESDTVDGGTSTAAVSEPDPLLGAKDEVEGARIHE